MFSLDDKIKMAVATWLEDKFKLLLTGVGIAADGLQPILVVLCIIGIYMRMFGAKESGTKMSSLSFFGYLVLKVITDVYGK